MMRACLLAAAALQLGSRFAAAQTFSECNPLAQDCPANAALGKTIDVDFTRGASSQYFDYMDPSNANQISYDAARGAVFTIAKDTDAPGMKLKSYIFFGRVDVTMQAAPGAGIVTSIVLISDDLGEIDLEWIGGDPTTVQSNYFGRHLETDTIEYGQGSRSAVPGGAATSAAHTYSIDWTPTAITFLIDNAPIRSVSYADAGNGARFPQTPMRLRLGSWVAGKAGVAQGTIDWAGGLANFADAPFVAVYRSVKVADYGNGVQGATEYAWRDRRGVADSVAIVGGSAAAPLPGPSSVTTSTTLVTSTTTMAAPTTTSARPSTTASISGNITVPPDLRPAPTAAPGQNTAPPHKAGVATAASNLAIVAAVAFLLL